MTAGGESQGQSVEDVLSAIRRLVTDEESQRRRPPPTEVLLLTQAMRVEEEPLRLDPVTQAVPAAPPFSERELANLVREIVRAELQGELGERISANIRKLVRREVSRALNARMTE